MSSNTGNEECGVEYDTEMCQGSTFSRTFEMLDEEEDPIDLSADTFEAQMRSLPSNANVIIDFTCSVEGVDNNILKILATAVETAAVSVPAGSAEDPRPTKDYYYDIERTQPSGIVTKVAFGKITVHPEVTK